MKYYSPVTASTWLQPQQTPETAGSPLTTSGWYTFKIQFEPDTLKPSVSTSDLSLSVNSPTPHCPCWFKPHANNSPSSVIKKKLCYCPACYQNMICICSFWLLVTLQAIKCYIEYPGVKATHRYMWCWTLAHCMCWYLWLQESGNHQLPLFCTCDSQVM